MPAARHLMSKFFSPPMSAPKPASVTTKPSWPTSFRPNLSATTDDWPWAMFAKGPQWTMTGVPSRVCIKVGIKASFKSTAKAPVTPRSSQVTKSLPPRSRPTAMSPSLFFKSSKDVAKARTAMISEATAISKPASLVFPFSVAALPISTLRRNRSHVSTTRCQVIVAGSICNRVNFNRSSGVRSSASSSFAASVIPRRFSLPTKGAAIGLVLVALFKGISRSNKASSFCVLSWNMRASMAAATKLFAATTAWMSPVKWRLKVSIGTTCA
mmetsp:Transcript_27490/g.88806  ORF Transcript_27490/g.88806 Transcript_27490/m.88806 type:complete len:269 (+) Transcript_27490:2100-2906(+)